jgi:hypothetical protein
MRVTFPGTVLPDQLDLDGLLIKVSKCKEKIMICQKCLKYGHTSQFCNGIPRCSKCGETHDGPNCRLQEFICPNCKKNHSKFTECEAFKKLRDSTEQRAKRRLDISYAQAAKARTTFNFQLSNENPDQNPYSILGQQNDTSGDSEQTQDGRPSQISTNKITKKNKSKKINGPSIPTKKRRVTPSAESEDIPVIPSTSRQPVTAAEPKTIKPMIKVKKRTDGPNSGNFVKLTAFGGLVSAVCDLFKVTPGIKTLVLTLLVPIIEQIWPSISTLKIPSFNSSTHG